MNLIKLYNTISLLVLLAVAGGSIAAQQPTAQPSAQPIMNDTATAPQPSSQLVQRYPRYVIQRQDVLSICFPLSPELNQTDTVQPDGFITLQDTGSIHIQGMTVPQAVDAIKSAYSGILRDPIVNVDLQDFQKPFFTVNGQVGKPGQYDLRSDLTVSEAIAVAGGLAPTSRMQAFLFHKVNSQWFHVEKLNLKDVFNGKKANEDAILQPGDMIFVPENNITKFRKYVPYGVNAGSYLAENQSY
jgi:polysaccharide export outer membrane protein